MSSQPEHRADEAGPSSQVAEVPEGLPAIGEVLAGKYRIERVLGIGGMGVVLAAMHLHLGERVALKFLLPSVATAETVERFAREARAAARIKSEHVARVTDVSQTEAGATYMVMEFLEGSDLSDVLRDGGPLPLRDAVEYVIQASDAIADAHAMGIVHRDLKPANLFLARRPGAPARIKVLDFGISKITPRDQGDEAPIYQQRAMTHTRAWLGSPLYMAPEQMKSAKGVDARTDIWSLGVILFELLAGTAPFTGGNLPELCAEILHGKPADLLSKRAEVPHELDEVIRKCLEKDPSLRFQNIAEFVMALVDFAPRRARSVAERAVSLIEGAGLMRKSIVPRAALDSTLAGDGLSPRDSVAPPSSLRLEEPSIPRPPRTPSFAPDHLANVGQAATMVAPPPGVDTESGTRRRSAALVPIL
ncbi:MAG TPA: serine/threonine-protein kinase, partial [Byssovorax sp.]